jgi:hypothetical protein
MKMTTLTKLGVLTPGVATFLAMFGLFTPAFAGPEPLMDNSKEKMIQMAPPQEEPKWYLSFGVGTDFDTDATDFSNGFDQTVSPVAVATAVPTNISTNNFGGRFESARLRILPRSWNDAYSNFGNIHAEVGRRVGCSCFEVFGTFDYSHADSETLTGSGLELAFTNYTKDIPFVSHFDDYNAYGGQLGARWYPLRMRTQFPIQPYLSVAGGATYVDCIGLHSWATSFGHTFTVFDGPFYDSSVVGTVTGKLGLDSRITTRFSVGVEVGLTYQTSLSGNDKEFERFNTGLLGGNLAEDLKGINGSGDQLKIPLSFFAKYRF